MTQAFRYPDLPTDSYSAARPIIRAATGLGANQKKLMAITAATLLLGGGVGLVIAGRKGNETTDTELGTDVTSTPHDKPQNSITIPADVDVAGKVDDSMSFERAFEVARDEVGMGGVFNWHGGWYNTFEKEEWSGLSLEQRQEYVQMITGEKLPVKPYARQQTTTAEPQAEETIEPTVIEGHLNGQRVMGLDFDQDGIIDTMVMDGADGHTYRIVDATGDQGLDTLYVYDSMDGELVLAAKIDSTVISNDQFSQGLEASMSKEVVDSILESDVPNTTTAPVDEIETVAAPENDYPQYIADASEPDDTYINNGDVQDMER